MSPAASRPRSIAVSIFALVIGAVIVMAATFFAITFLGPPPRPAPEMMDTIVHVLRTGKNPPPGAMAPPPEPPGVHPGPRFGPGGPRRGMSSPRSLVFNIAASAPGPRRNERPDAWL